MTTHRDSLTTLRQVLIKNHEGKLRAVDALLALLDENGMMPEPVVSMAADLLKKFHPESSNPSKAPAVENTTQTTTIIPSASRSSQTLEEAVTEAMVENPQHRSWSSRQLLGVLTSRGYVFSGNKDNSTNKISGVLIRMLGDGKLTRLIHGRGRRPSIYEWVFETLPLENEKEASMQETS